MKYQERATQRDTVKAERVLVEQPLSDRLLLNYGNSENQSFYGLSCSEISASASSSEQKLQLRAGATRSKETEKETRKREDMAEERLREDDRMPRQRKEERAAELHQKPQEMFHHGRRECDGWVYGQTEEEGSEFGGTAE
ncbi:unnamed protein product [Pleuronectes platessa]|uniref:Uncharacterized protein n=1 Tax=Pleuronectes platessa TaxID=8262 RepID=A0A9N7V5S9_PLEPL|nr:unnamed protein product [Pleuronectes platessa]